MRPLVNVWFATLILFWSVTAAAAQQVRIEGQTDSVVPAGDVFLTHVGPLFEKRCWECHSGDSAEGDLRLDSAEGLRAGGSSGPLWVVAEPGQSRLIEMVSGQEPQMPLDGEPLSALEIAAIRDWISNGAAIPANWPTANEPSRPKHWSLQPIQRPAIPAVKNANWPLNEIDNFILAQLERNQLTPSAPADRRTLFRRLTYDVWGLPPDPDAVRQFVEEKNSQVHETTVDRLLASPHYGERWARYWLDVVRFAESSGFETNIPRPNAWPYRDYVIRALNEDRAFDRFVVEQLAGDALGVDEATGFLVAGAWDQVKSPDPVLTANQRADELHDIVSTTGSAFLGLTVGCARCHDHKFDPITQADYYAVTACLSGVQHGERPFRSGIAVDNTEKLAELRGELFRIDAELRAFEPMAQVATLSTGEQANEEELVSASASAVRAAVRPQRNVDRFPSTDAKMLRLTILRTTDVEPCLDEVEVYLAAESHKNAALADTGTKATASSVYPNSEIHRLEHVNDGKYGNGRSWISNESGKGWVQFEFPETVAIDRVVWGRDRLKQFTDRLAIDYRIEVSIDGDAWQVVATSEDRQPYDSSHLVAHEFGSNQLTDAARTSLNRWIDQRDALEARFLELSRVPMAYAGSFVPEPEATFRLFRGDPLQKREPIQPGALSAIPVAFALPPTASESERRMALAQWIVDPANPLTARVIVNRLWQYHFGEGLVSTPSDFGANGAQPSHPGLLDWLAAELMENDWSLKHIHRLILNSQTYRQSSELRAGCFAVDAQSRWLWRFPPRRLEAEPIRDSILVASGKLDSRMGGPGFSVFQPNDNYVRVYAPLQEFGPEQWRRMIYATVIRQRLDGVFGVFDCPDGGQIAPKRNRSTTPLQALNLLNSRFMIEQADFLAARLGAEAGPEPRAQVQRAFELVYQRTTSDDEINVVVQFASDHGIASVCRALFSSSEFIYMY